VLAKKILHVEALARRRSSSVGHFFSRSHTSSVEAFYLELKRPPQVLPVFAENFQQSRSSLPSLLPNG
jgi:hypothetical protein